MRFGRLLVVGRSLHRGAQARWVCKCDCGIELTVRGQDLRNGHTQSCGCLHAEITRSIAAKHNKTHGMTDTPIYAVWRGMMNRCYSSRSESFASYGARGIKVCQEWHAFDAFYQDMGRLRPSRRHSIDRIDNDGDYRPGNVRWVLPVVQQNNRRNNIRVSHNGQALTVSQWARIAGLSRETLQGRIARNWPMPLALALPPNSRQRVAST